LARQVNVSLLADSAAAAAGGGSTVSVNDGAQSKPAGCDRQPDELPPPETTAGIGGYKSFL